jgi:hypothetical protein
VDPVGADTPHFPPANVGLVRQRLAALFVAEGATALVCSAACGADLAALAEAQRLGLRRRIVLPFDPERFRETSVTDRPGRWGPLFDRLIATARAAGDLVVLDSAGSGDEDGDAYEAANRAIIEQARSLAASPEGGTVRRPVAAIVWEGEPHGERDSTNEFRRLAEKAGFEIRFVLTG